MVVNIQIMLFLDISFYFLSQFLKLRSVFTTASLFLFYFVFFFFFFFFIFLLHDRFVSFDVVPSNRMEHPGR